MKTTRKILRTIVRVAFSPLFILGYILGYTAEVFAFGVSEGWNAD